MSQRKPAGNAGSPGQSQSSKSTVPQKTLLGYFGSKSKPSGLPVEEAPVEPEALPIEVHSPDVEHLEVAELERASNALTMGALGEHPTVPVPASQPAKPVIPSVRKRPVRKVASEQRVPTKPLFSIFAKQSTSLSTAVTPRTFSPDVEVMHILDSSPPPPESFPAISAMPAGLSRQNPIEVSEMSPSPEKPTRKPMILREGVAPTRRFPKFRPEPEGPPLAPFPARGDQHVNMALPMHAPIPLSNIAKRSSGKDAAADPVPWMQPGRDPESFPAECSRTPVATPAHPNRASFVKSLPPEHVSVPSIARALEKTDAKSNSQEDWAQRWRPLCAAEVLGNEKNASYLRDWLKTLSVQLEAQTPAPPSPVKPPIPQVGRARKSLKRKEISKPQKRQIIRTVSKAGRRKRQRLDSDEEDNWIVRSDEEEEDHTNYTDYDDLDELNLLANVQTDGEEPPDSRPESLASDDAMAPLEDIWDFSGWLTNTILISGPPGCGKTAAVYACAAELDWEIFEVYPGIGKRSGANVEGLVGDVGKNHLVQLQRRSKRQGSLVNGVEDDSPPEDETTSGVRQSAILLEEVDVLFKDDVNFWPSVIDLVRECKRPVILTCSDESLVPVEELPLQVTLRFEACPPEVATSFLQAVAWAEGLSPTRAHVAGVYNTVYSLNPFDLPDIPLHPLHAPFPCRDLRKSLHHLQFLCSSVSQSDHQGSKQTAGIEVPGESRVHGSIAWEEAQSTWKHMLERIESMSFIDSSSRRTTGISAWGLSLNDYGALSDHDTEVGRETLKDPCQGVGTDQVWDLYERDSEMADLGINLACGASVLSDTEDTYRLPLKRAAFQSEMLKVLENILDIGGPLMPRGVVFTEYEAWVRCIVAADDANERDESKQYHQRRTRSRQVYHRTLRLGEEELEIVRRTGLRTECSS